jgi:hypothetical protein
MTSPSNLDMFVAELTGNAESNYIGIQHQVPFRIDGHQYAKLNTLISLYDMHARERGRRAPSRNKVLNDLLAISIDAVLAKLGDHDKVFFDEIYSKFSIGVLRYVEGEEEVELLKQETRYANKKLSEAAKGEQQ